MCSKTHVIHIGIGNIFFGHQNRIVPKTKSVHRAITLGHCKERLTIIAFHSHHQVILSVQFNSTRIHRRIDTETDIPDTNMYDMRLTAHEDGWIYGIFCAERKDPNARPGDLSAAVASAGIARTKDLKTWERLPDLKTRSQQRNVVLHPEFVNGKYALYTRPQDGFIDTGNGGGIGWALVDDICHAEVHDEVIINKREYHTIKEVKNGEGPHPIKTEKGWLHLAHGVRCCAAGLRYVLYLYMTSLEDPTKMIAEPAGYFMAPVDEERIGDVSNVLFSNGWIADEDGKVYIYYASSDTRMHVAESTVDRLVDYCLHTPADGLRSIESVRTIIAMVDHNKKILK